MRISVVAACLLTFAACKGKPVPVTTGSGAGSGSAVAAGSGVLSGSGASMGATVPTKFKNVAPDIVLPHSDGSAPVKTTGPIPGDKMAAMAALQFPGFLREVKSADTKLEVIHKTDSRPRIKATVFIDSCSAVSCTPIAVDAWKPKTDQLKTALPPELRADPGTTFDLGEATFDGTKAIYTTLIAQHFEKDEQGNQQGSYGYSYTLYYNDGANQIRVVAEYNDDPMQTRDDMTKAVPLTDLQRVATAFLDVFTHAW